jgi:hypothetical protein
MYGNSTITPCTINALIKGEKEKDAKSRNKTKPKKNSSFWARHSGTCLKSQLLRRQR